MQMLLSSLSCSLLMVLYAIKTLEKLVAATASSILTVGEIPATGRGNSILLSHGPNPSRLMIYKLYHEKT